MKSSTQYTPNNSFGLLLVGPPGTGKTTACLSFPRPYIADCDNNLSGVARQGRSFLYDTISVDEPNETQRWEKLLLCVRSAAHSADVGTIIIDSITAVGDYVIDHVCRINGRTRKDMRIQDWGEIFITMKKFIVGSRMLGKPVIFTAHEAYDKDEATGILKFRIAFPGQMRDIIAALFSDMWHTEVVDVPGKPPSYVVRVMPTARIECKNSLGAKTQVFEPSPETISTLLGIGTPVR